MGAIVLVPLSRLHGMAHLAAYSVLRGQPPSALLAACAQRLLTAAATAAACSPGAAGRCAATPSRGTRAHSTAAGGPEPDTEVAVIGAGVIGLAIARQLALAGRGVLLLEAAGAFGTETSSRNSEVVHAGECGCCGCLTLLVRLDMLCHAAQGPGHVLHIAAGEQQAGRRGADATPLACSFCLLAGLAAGLSCLRCVLTAVSSRLPVARPVLPPRQPQGAAVRGGPAAAVCVLRGARRAAPAPGQAAGGLVPGAAGRALRPGGAGRSQRRARPAAAEQG